MSLVMIGTAGLSVTDVAAIADGALVDLSPDVLARMFAGRAVVEDVLSSGAAVYGLTTGVGHLKDTRIPDDALVQAQLTLLRLHAGGIEPLAQTWLVRSAMAARLAGLAQGGSGATVDAALAIRDLLNAKVHPVVPAEGSVGAGDLGQMAAIALVAVGEGRAEYGGEVMPGGTALQRAGLRPLSLRPKDGLALMSANGISIGRAARAVVQGQALVDVADIAAGLSLRAVGGDPAMADPAVGAAKPLPGLSESCRVVRAAVADEPGTEGPAPRSVQDPLAFRVAPQVNGAFRDVLAGAREAAEAELNSVSDNPMVDLATGRLIHNGNFHPIGLAVSMDTVRVAAAHVGQLSERRINHLWDEFFAVSRGGGEQLVDAEPPQLPGLQLRFPAAAALAELKQLAAPATLDVPTLEFGLEDHATGAPLSARKTLEALELLAGILGVELLMVRDVMRVSGAAGPGPVAAAALEALDVALAGEPDRSPATVHRVVQESALPAVRAEALTVMAELDA